MTAAPQPQPQPQSSAAARLPVPRTSVGTAATPPAIHRGVPEGATEAGRSTVAQMRRWRLAAAGASAMFALVCGVGELTAPTDVGRRAVALQEWNNAREDTLSTDVLAAGAVVRRSLGATIVTPSAEITAADRASSRVIMRDLEKWVAASGRSVAAADGRGSDALSTYAFRVAAATSGAPAAAIGAYGSATPLVRTSTFVTASPPADQSVAWRWGRLLSGVGATVALAAASLWLAKKTRRVVNPALAGAAIVLAASTWVATPVFDPGSTATLSADAQSATTLARQVRDLRWQELAPYKVAPSVETAKNDAGWLSTASSLVTNLNAVGVGEDFSAYRQAHTALEEASTPAERADALAKGDAAISDILNGLRSKRSVDIGAPASEASPQVSARVELSWPMLGVLGGAAAAALAWTGITRRLRDYE